MSCGNGCCESDCSAVTTGCSTFESQVGLCECQSGVRCSKRTDCGGCRPSGSVATGACPGPCQCAEEEIWNSNVPPKPNCEWLNNFAELRRQWSDHGRQLSCKCCNCRSSKSSIPCRPCLPVVPSCSASVLPSSGSQVNWNNRMVDDNCNNSALRSIENSCADNVALSQDCGANACAMPCLPRKSADSCQPCAPLPKPILKKRSCCECPIESCSCQPMARNCNCPPPVQVDVRTVQDCTCECPSSPECACPPSERRLARSKVRCPNARLCCPFPRPSPGLKDCCPQCQPCPPARCEPCVPSKYRPAMPNTKSCRSSSPCVPRSPCRSMPVPPPCQKTIPACYVECEHDGKRTRSADMSSFYRGRSGQLR